jgi:hypothetical protein
MYFSSLGFFTVFVQIVDSMISISSPKGVSDYSLQMRSARRLTEFWFPLSQKPMGIASQGSKTF